MKTFDLRVKQLLDGDLSLADLPPELRAEGEEALRLLAAVDRTPVTLSPALDARVMAVVRQHATKSPVRRPWRWLNTPRDLELRLRVRPWTVWAGALAAAAALALLLGRAAPAPVPDVQARGGTRDSVFVRFVLYAPGARRVAVAGTFNQWDRGTAPLAPAGTSGGWTATLPPSV